MLNTVTLMISFSRQPAALELALFYANIFFLIIFVLEALLKIFV